MKVLIADDDRVFAAVLGAGLRAQGWQVQVAHDAMQAFMFANRRDAQPDAIVMDLNMPAGNGTGAMQRLQGSARTAQIPVVVITGDTGSGVAARMRALGAAGFFHKPVDPIAVSQLLAQAIGVGAPAHAGTVG